MPLIVAEALQESAYDSRSFYSRVACPGSWRRRFREAFDDSRAVQSRVACLIVAERFRKRLTILEHSTVELQAMIAAEALQRSA